VLRLVLNIIFFLGSLLCITVAPTFRLWIFSIAISEFPLIFVSVSLLLLTWSILGKKINPTLQKFNIGLAALALINFSYPIADAWYIGWKLPTEIAVQLGGQPQTGNVFRFSRMLSMTEEVSYETMPYTTRGNEDLTLDFYQSTKRGRRPCVVVIHGGSWRGGNSQQLPELNSELARHGFQVASVNYRLAPKHRNPAPIEDINDALKYLKKNSRELKIDTNNFILLGRSAGAQLAMVTAYTQDIPGVRGVVNFYGPTDMVWGYEVPANPFIMDSRKVLEDFLGGPLSKVPDVYKASSPVEVVSTKSIPTLIIHGANDGLVSIEHGERLKEKLMRNKIPHYMLSLPWATHGCDYTINGPSGQLTTYAVEYFVNHVVKQVNPDIHLTSADRLTAQAEASRRLTAEKLSTPGAYGSSGN
jgi:acetyl esterase/lipase